MKPLTNLFLDIFFRFAISTYVLLAFMLGIWKMNQVTNIIFLVMIILLAFFMSFFLIKIQKNELAGMGLTEFSDSDLKPKQKAVISSRLGLRVIKLILPDKMDVVKIQRNKKEQYIIAKTAWSWKSFGETIQISQKQEKDGIYLYEISSKPKEKITKLDYGKGIENINCLKKVLS